MAESLSDGLVAVREYGAKNARAAQHYSGVILAHHETCSCWRLANAHFRQRPSYHAFLRAVRNAAPLLVLDFPN